MTWTRCCRGMTQLASKNSIFYTALLAVHCINATCMPDFIFRHLNDLSYQRVRPSLRLSPYVEWFWQVHCGSNIGPLRREAMHPNGALAMVFNAGHAIRKKGGVYAQGLSIDAPSEDSGFIDISGPMHAFGIVLKPWAASSFFSVPVNHLDDTMVCAETFPKTAVPPEELFKSGPFGSKVLLAESWLAKVLSAYSGHGSAAVKQAADIVSRCHGQLTVSELSRRIGLSSRQLERLFGSHLGLSPKQYSKVCRVRYARHLIKYTHVKSLTDIAFMAGFSDQSHFIREFSHIVGCTPNWYRKKSLLRGSV